MVGEGLGSGLGVTDEVKKVIGGDRGGEPLEGLSRADRT